MPVDALKLCLTSLIPFENRKIHIIAIKKYIFPKTFITVLFDKPRLFALEYVLYGNKWVLSRMYKE